MNHPAVNLIDARGPRFAALITTGVLALILLTESVWLLGFQLLAFALGATLGPARSPYGLIYRILVQPRLSSDFKKEESKPPQFAQFVGFLFALAGLIGLILEIQILFFVAISLALVAAVLNAFFDFCLGCQMYLILKRLQTK